MMECCAKGDAHWTQNLALSGFSASHVAQRMSAAPPAECDNIATKGLIAQGCGDQESGKDSCGIAV
jgi:hypothetical protein